MGSIVFFLYKPEIYFEVGESKTDNKIYMIFVTGYGEVPTRFNKDCTSIDIIDLNNVILASLIKNLVGFWLLEECINVNGCGDLI